MSIVDQRLNKASALQYATLNFIKKVDLMQDLSVEALKVLIYSQVKLLGGGFSSLKLQVQGSSRLIKKDFTTELFLHGSCAVSLFKLSRNFLRDTFAKHVVTKSQASNLQVTPLLKIKTICERLCVKDYSYIHMPILMAMPMPVCPYRDFQMVVSLDFVSFVWKRRIQFQRWKICMIFHTL